MKTKLKIAFFAVCVCVWAYVCSREKKAASDSLQLMNIEALANKESGSVKCMGYGSIDCPSYNVKVYYYYY